MIKLTDKLVSAMPPVYVSQGVRSKKLLADSTDRIIVAIETTLPLFKKLLIIPDNLKFRICTFKGNTRGLYNNEEKTISIAPLKSIHNVMVTLAHELVHAEQFYTKRLAHVKVPRKGYRMAWNGAIGSKGTTRNAYLNQPWEKEAFGRQEKLANQVLEMLEAAEKSNS